MPEHIAMGSAGLFLTAIKPHETAQMHACHYPVWVWMHHQSRTSEMLGSRNWAMMSVEHFKTWNLKVTRWHLNKRELTDREKQCVHLLCWICNNLLVMFEEHVVQNSTAHMNLFSFEPRPLPAPQRPRHCVQIIQDLLEDTRLCHRLP